jgi:hypothetical protein
MIASTAMSAGGTIMAGNAAAESGNYNAAMLRQQAAYEETQVADAIVRGSENVREVQKAGAQVQGAGRASAATGNIDINFGSPLDVMLDNARNIELDVMRTSENARREADGIRFGAAQTRKQATLTQMEGKNTQAAARIGAVGTVLSGGASYYKYKAGLTAGQIGSTR